MTEYRATPEQWAFMVRCGSGLDPDTDSSCILELRARVEALESAQQPHQDKLDRLIALDRSGSLVERVAAAIDHANKTGETDARAAIREVAEWLRSEYPRREGYGTAWANLLDENASL
jgi:hypothetical protein